MVEVDSRESVVDREIGRNPPARERLAAVVCAADAAAATASCRACSRDLDRCTLSDSPLMVRVMAAGDLRDDLRLSLSE